MQAEQLQRVQEELLAVRQSLQPLQKRQQTELLKDKPNKAMLKELKEAIAPLAAEQQQLLDERIMLETQPKGEHWGTAPNAWPTLCWAHPASCGKRTHRHLSSQVVAVAAVVHLLDLAAPAEVGAMHATRHLRAQAACIDLHAAHHALQKPLVPAAASSPCQVTARHDGRAAPWRWQHGGKCWSRRHQLALHLCMWLT